jgi:hypothetical protein
MTEPERDDPEVPELRALPRDTSAPAALEERTVAALRREGLLVGPHSSLLRSRWPLAIAASVAFFALGAYWGRQTATTPAPPSDHRPRYLLLLRQGQLRPAVGVEEEGRVREYGDWAARLRAAGVAARGARLTDDGMTLAAAPVSPSPVRVAGSPDAILGYFVISARDLEEGLRLARGCPHLRHGGVIEVRPIDPT